MLGCPFCDRLEGGDIAIRTEGAAAFPDAFPVSEGHTLIVPVVHEENFFSLDVAYQRAAWELAAQMRAELAERLGVAAFNIGLNDGVLAGQTVEHAHIHVIPRRRGDVADP